MLQRGDDKGQETWGVRVSAFILWRWGWGRWTGTHWGKWKGHTLMSNIASPMAGSWGSINPQTRVGSRYHLLLPCSREILFKFNFPEPQLSSLENGDWRSLWKRSKRFRKKSESIAHYNCLITIVLLSPSLIINQFGLALFVWLWGYK